METSLIEVGIDVVLNCLQLKERMIRMRVGLKVITGEHNELRDEVQTGADLHWMHMMLTSTV